MEIQGLVMISSGIVLTTVLRNIRIGMSFPVTREVATRSMLKTDSVASSSHTCPNIHVIHDWLVRFVQSLGVAEGSVASIATWGNPVVSRPPQADDLGTATTHRRSIIAIAILVFFMKKFCGGNSSFGATPPTFNRL